MLNYNRQLDIDWRNWTPSGTVLHFTSASGVSAYYGYGSDQANEANEFFKNAPPDSVLDFTRFTPGQRPHLLGRNLAGSALSDLQSIHGTVELDFDGYHYQGHVDMAHTRSTGGPVSGFLDMATEIRQALNTNRDVGATVAGAWIEPRTVKFYATVKRAQIEVTQLVSGGPVTVGGFVTGGTIRGPANIIIANHGSNGGPGPYSFFSGVGPDINTPTLLTETYGILHTPDVTSGIVRLGEQMTGGVNPCAVIGQLGADTWVVSDSQAASNLDLTMRAPLLQVGTNWQNIPIVDKNGVETNRFFDVMPNGLFGYDNNPSTMSFAYSPPGDPTADQLGISQAGGALPPYQGGWHGSMKQFLTNAIKWAGDSFGRIHSLEPRLWDNLQAANDTYFGGAYQIVTTAPGHSPPAGDLSGHFDHYHAAQSLWGVHS